ncbi:YtjB family periplasmic protein [Thaumasiovibrio subtropicus]|uniref:YtjB family periplasmic protein n=1 Tax=Thaumasiovibrio subtropicus TaxID=1891207 RepID=UPI000B34E85E|nr:AhpA/YtjB family protein [Thaumasiovibrio subtropicus]
MSNYRKRLLRVWQVTVILLTLGGLAIMLKYSAHLSVQNNQAINEQTELLSRVVIRQAADTAAPSIAESDQQALESLITQLSREPLLLDATIYDAEGITIARTKNAMPLSQTLGLNTPLSVASLGRRQLVEPILFEGNMVGFIRITLEKGRVNAAANNQVDAHINIIRGLILAAMALGALLVFTFARRKSDQPLFLLPHQRN